MRVVEPSGTVNDTMFMAVRNAAPAATAMTMAPTRRKSRMNTWVGSDAARYGSDFQADYVDGPLEHVRLEKCSQASCEIVGFALSEAFESRTATSPGRLRATSTQLPLWLL